MLVCAGQIPEQPRPQTLKLLNLFYSSETHSPFAPPDFLSFHLWRRSILPTVASWRQHTVYDYVYSQVHAVSTSQSKRTLGQLSIDRCCSQFWQSFAFLFSNWNKNCRWIYKSTNKRKIILILKETFLKHVLKLIRHLTDFIIIYNKIMDDSIQMKIVHKNYNDKYKIQSSFISERKLFSSTFRLFNLTANFQQAQHYLILYLWN